MIAWLRAALRSRQARRRTAEAERWARYVHRERWEQLRRAQAEAMARDHADHGGDQ